MIAILLVPFVLLCVADGVEMVKKKQWKELGVTSLLLGAAVSLVIFQKIDWPTPVDLIIKLLKPVGKIIF